MSPRSPLPGLDLPVPVLREYALLADGERGVLIGPGGDFVWMCFPRWHSPALFGSMIGGRGNYLVTPVGRHVWGGYYEPRSLIWHSRWVTQEGVVESRDALAMPGMIDQAVVLRRIRAAQGATRVRIVLNLRSDFGRRGPRRIQRDEDGRWIFELEDGARASWTGAEEATLAKDGDGDQLELDLRLPEGESRDLVLTLGATAEQAAPVDADIAWQATESSWSELVPALSELAGTRDATHAYAVMAGLTSGGGGMVAAATTSLPERAEQGRSYDYRYVWIRDQCYAGQAVAAAGPYALLDDAVRFVRDRLLDDGRTLKPAYTVDGAPVPDQSSLKLAGYPGGTDIVGNWVNKQFQLDAFGESLLLFTAAGRRGRLDPDSWRAAEAAVDAIERRWQEKDAGIWEIEPRAWTHSRLICVAGLRAISRQPEAGPAAGRWASLADRILADTAAHAVHESGRWQRAPDDPRVDAALLLPAIRGAVEPTDPRSVATLTAVERELTVDDYCYRYRPDDRPLGQAEGAFLLCGFFASMAWQQQGELVKAARWFERTRAACGPPGLLSEEFDVRQRQLRGNLPQAFVHALLLESAVRLGEVESSLAQEAGSLP